MSQHKAAGSTKNGRDSAGRRLGVKLFAGQTVIPGNILIRQRGTKFVPGKNTYASKDHTIHAEIAGKVAFSEKRFKKYDGRVQRKTVVNVE